RCGSGSRDRRPVVREPHEEEGSLPDLLRLAKAGLAHQAANSILGIVGETPVGMKMGEKAVRSGLSPREIEKMKGTARLQDAPDLAKRGGLLLRRQVMEHQRREDEIEGRCG